MKIFVAHPFSPHPLEGYRDAFLRVGEAFRQRGHKVEFLFGDEHLSGQHILDKIQNMIEDSALGIYDLTGWNPNVALELGLAIGLGQNARIVVNSSTNNPQMPSDVQGYERTHYKDRMTLEVAIKEIVERAMTEPDKPGYEHFSGMTEIVKKSLRDSGDYGMTARKIEEETGIPFSVLTAVLKFMYQNDDELLTYGAGPGTRYYLSE